MISCQHHQPRQSFVWYFHLWNQHVQRPRKCSCSRNHAQVSENQLEWNNKFFQLFSFFSHLKIFQFVWYVNEVVYDTTRWKNIFKGDRHAKMINFTNDIFRDDLSLSWSNRSVSQPQETGHGPNVTSVDRFRLYSTLVSGMSEITIQYLDFLWKRGAKHKSLPIASFWHCVLFYNPSDLWLKAHIQHTICFVQYQKPADRKYRHVKMAITNTHRHTRPDSWRIRADTGSFHSSHQADLGLHLWNTTARKMGIIFLTCKHQDQSFHDPTCLQDVLA
jgi:hypothetical protein